MCCTATKNKHRDFKVAIKVEKDHLDVPKEWEEYPQLEDYPPDDPSLNDFLIFVNGDEVFIFTNNKAYLEWASGKGYVMKLFNIFVLLFQITCSFARCKEFVSALTCVEKYTCQFLCFIFQFFPQN